MAVCFNLQNNIKKITKFLALFLFLDGLNCNVQIIDSTAYCRLRTALKRAEGKEFKEILRCPKLVALYGLRSIKPDHHIMYCKETFECPELENHDYRCDHLGKWLN